MSGIMYLRDGLEVPITQHVYEHMIPQLRMKANLKMWKSPDGDYICLSPSNLLMVKYIPEEEPKKEEPVVVKKASQPGPTEVKNIVKEEPKKEESAQEKADKALAEMIEKSNCKHEPEKMELFVQDTAKGVRYFPVCSFCGKRDRYVSEKKILDGAYEGTPNEKWTEDDIKNAKPWIEG